MTAAVDHYWLNGWETFEGWGIPMGYKMVPGPTVSSVTMDGVVDSSTTSIIAWDVGVSAAIGTTTYWVFGDTIFSPADVSGRSYIQSSGGIGSTSDIHTLVQQTDANGAPVELFTVQNSQDEDGEGTRHPFWADTIVVDPAGTGLVHFYQQAVVPKGEILKHHWEYGYVDEIAASSPMTQNNSNAVQLWDYYAGEPGFVSGGLIDGGYLYLYPWEAPYYVARVAWTGTLYRTKANYEYWTGSGWSSTIGNAVPVELLGVTSEDRLGGFGGLTVVWNAYLGKYLMSHAKTWGDRQDGVLRTADAPTGPWSAPTYVDVSNSYSGALYGNYTFRMHKEFFESSGQTIVFTYARTTGPLSQELAVVRVAFA